MLIPLCETKKQGLWLGLWLHSVCYKYFRVNSTRALNLFGKSWFTASHKMCSKRFLFFPFLSFCLFFAADRLFFDPRSQSSHFRSAFYPWDHFYPTLFIAIGTKCFAISISHFLSLLFLWDQVLCSLTPS